MICFRLSSPTAPYSFFRTIGTVYPVFLDDRKEEHYFLVPGLLSLRYAKPQLNLHDPDLLKKEANPWLLKKDDCFMNKAFRHPSSAQLLIVV